MATRSCEFSLGGLLLAGGRSTRMGSDKALLQVDGELLWRRQHALLARSGVTVPLYVSVRPEQTWPSQEFLRVNDPVADAGPLSGIVGALRLCPCSHLLVLAIDLPRMSERWFAELCENCDSVSGAIGRHPTGLFEPLAAIYPRSVLPLAEAQLLAGNLSLHALVRKAIAEKFLRTREISAQQAALFVNWNEPGDLTSPSSP